MWPFICQFIEKLFRETIEPAVRGAHTHLSTFSFTRVDVGQQVCFFLSVLTCAQLKRMVNCLRLSLEKAALRKAGSVCGSSPGLPPMGPSPPLLGPRLVSPLWSLGQSRSVGGPLSPRESLPHVLLLELPLYNLLPSVLLEREFDV